MEGHFYSFLGALFSRGGGVLYVEIYLDLSPLAKNSVGVNAFFAWVDPNILEHIVIC